MKTSVLMIFLSFGLTVLQASPWDLDLETRNLLNSHIDAIHQKRNNEAISLGKTNYMIDYERKRINLNSRDALIVSILNRSNTSSLKRDGPIN